MSRTLRSVAALLAAACWLAAPAVASSLPGTSALNEGATTTTDVAGSVAAARPVRTAVGSVTAPRPVRAAVDTPARPVRGAAETVAATRAVRTAVETAAAVQPVRAAVETVAAAPPGVRPAVEGAARRATELAGAGTDGSGRPAAGAADGRPPAGPDIRDARGAARGVTAQAARLQGPAAGWPAMRPAQPFLAAPLAAIQASAQADFSSALPGAVQASPGAAVESALDSRSAPDPAPADGSGSAAGAGSFLMGGLAVLLATLSLAGPALRRRLPRLTVTAWPSAFVPLLERPG